MLGRRASSIKIRTMLFFLFTCPMIWAGGKGPNSAKAADLIVIVKSTRTMTLYSGRTVLKTFRVSLSRASVGPKERAGDHKTPEGNYVVDATNAHSQFHLALHLSYPNASDRERARRLGVSPGGDVEIHGLPKGYSWLGGAQRLADWTDGCIAVTNPEIEQIWRLVPVGTRVSIRP